MVRIKRRYLLLNVKFKGSHNQEAFIKEIRSHIQQVYGDFGVACLSRGFSIKKYEPRDGYMIISLRKGVHEMVMSTIPLITNVDNVPCCATIIHLSGTIRSSLKQMKLNYLMNLRASIAEKTNAQVKRQRLS